MADVVLKDRFGTPQVFSGVEELMLPSQDSTDETAVWVPYTKGESVSKTVEPDFSAGDMAVPIADGELVTELTITKPETLVPENIAEGIDVAGITGTLGAAGGLADWNIFVKIATAPTPFDSIWTIATPDELDRSGIVLYPYGVTNEELKTIMFMTKIRTAAMTEETKTTINFEYAQNWQIACTGATNNTDNGVLMYQTTTTGISVSRVAANTNGAWSLNQTFALNLSNTGFRHTGRLISSTRCPIGTYLFVILQHKTAKVCDTLV